jgi:dTDP-4-dehydrorhamnose 3,5-epimerase
VKLVPTEIPEVVRVEPRVFGDARGFFLEAWHAEKFRAQGVDATFVQHNQSRSSLGTLRGLHYQVCRPQGKLVRVVRGEIYDVAVDLRRSSPTFGRWVGERLSETNHRQLWIPPGFAHGFVALSAEADVVYLCTEVWVPEYDRCVRWDDPELGVAWPLPPGAPPLLSDKDAGAPWLRDAEVYP